MEPLANQSPTKTVFEILIAVITWFAIALQLHLSTGSVINFFSYFTILSNLLIAVSLTISLLAPFSKLGIFFSKVAVQSAIALYIFIVFLVYNLVLRGILVLNGWYWMVDNLLHVVTPLLYILYYFIFIPKAHLQWKDGIYWIYFPLVYLIYSLVRGATVHWYPYPFLNADTLGYPKVMLNVAIMLAVFLITGLVLIAIKRLPKKQEVV